MSVRIVKSPQQTGASAARRSFLCRCGRRGRVRGCAGAARQVGMGQFHRSWKTRRHCPHFPHEYNSEHIVERTSDVAMQVVVNPTEARFPAQR